MINLLHNTSSLAILHQNYVQFNNLIKVKNKNYFNNQILNQYYKYLLYK